MREKSKRSFEHHHLIRRYLLWAYKSTKESYERIERKTTQLIVDEFVLGYLMKNKCDIPQEFKTYIAQKHRDELKLKYADSTKRKLHPDYVYLKNRLSAIEAAIKHFLGQKELKRFEKLYEEEFSVRILQARDH